MLELLSAMFTSVLHNFVFIKIKTPLLGTTSQNQGTFGELPFSFTKVTAKASIIELSH
jgi:hypothetical protein